MVTALITIGTNILSYILGKRQVKATVRKTEAEAKLNEVEAVETAVAIWRQLAQDLKTESNALKSEITELRILVKELRLENEKLRAEIIELKKTRN